MIFAWCVWVKEQDQGDARARVCGGWLVPPRTRGITENLRLRDRRPVPLVFIRLFLAGAPVRAQEKHSCGGLMAYFGACQAISRS